MHADDACHPAGCAVEAGDLHDCFRELRGVRPGAAVLDGGQQLHDAGLAKNIDGSVVELAQVFVGLAVGAKFFAALGQHIGIYGGCH
ncbi:hypothetical protein OL239_16025 [Arthrobacter sp. ATA002]|uniref:hypothetical protein n=1 Tax=Arthrobacter sp. ATA002 TaxID=2991715 RepID=UPI0022A78C23|nr:hypothetical protein [Arthrobacter sp. ATA002]WAP51318.1 hypothetical protein OL239_16025 [Arthrobacter sp. ATA002]